MRTLGIRISIKAKPDDVFHVLTDYANYHHWNDWIKVLSGEPEVGKALVVKSRLWLTPPVKYQFERIDPGSLLFRRQSPSMYRHFINSERERLLYTQMDGSTLYSTKVRIGGLLGGLGMALVGRDIVRGIRDEAIGLKRFCEMHYAIDGLRREYGYQVDDDIELIDKIDEPDIVPIPGFLTP